MSWTRLAYGVLLVALLSSGCTSSGDDPTTNRSEGVPVESVSDRLRELEPAERVEVPQAGADSVRDPAAVTAGLWRIDACGLVPPRMTRTMIENAYSPHVCGFLENGRRWATLFVTVGEFLGQAERAVLEQKPIAGAKTYVEADGDGSQPCTVHIPVSPRYTIEIDGQLLSCADVTELAAHTVRQLRAGTTAVPPGAGEWDTCSLLRRGLDDRPAAERLVYGNDAYSPGIDNCTVRPASPPRAERLAAGTDPLPALSIHNTQEDEGRPLEIRGQWVDKLKHGQGRLCTMIWSESAVVSLTTRSCARSRAIAGRVIRAYDRPAPSVRPQLRLYRPGESEYGLFGACDGYFSLRQVPSLTVDASTLPPSAPGCRPYQKVDLADDPAELLRDAEADPNVACALARKAIDQNTASGLVPVVFAAPPREVTEMAAVETRPCAFIDPDDGSQILVVASARRLPHGLTGNKPRKSKLRFVPHRALRPGNARFETAAQAFGDALADPGYLAVFISPDPPYSKELEGPGDLEWDQRDQASAILDDITDKHFPETS